MNDYTKAVQDLIEKCKQSGFIFTVDWEDESIIAVNLECPLDIKKIDN